MSDEQIPGHSMTRAVILWDKFLEVSVKMEFSSIAALNDLLVVIADNEEKEPLCDEELHCAEFVEAFKRFIKAEIETYK